MIDSTSLRERAKQLRKIADRLDEAAAGIDELGQPSPQIEAGMTRYRRSDITQASSRDLCYTVLRDAGQPMTKAQIMQRLQEANRIITDGSLQSYLSRDKRLMSLGRGVWSLRPASPLAIPHSTNGGG
jgi:hypothetical protein